MAKTLIIEQVEVTQNGTLQIRMHKLSSDGDFLGNHRTAIPPGFDIDSQFDAVNQHMAKDGYSNVSISAIDRVKAIAQVVWTPEVLAAYQAAQANA